MESADAPPSKKAKLSSLSIGDQLPHLLLAKIFAYLPLKDRHQLCLVSSDWAAASRIPWSDVTFLNLRTIPREMVDSILSLCPMLQELSAKDLTINLAQKPNLPISANLHTMELRRLKFAINGLGGIRLSNDTISELFREYFTRFPKLTDLTWYDITLIDSANGRSAACFGGNVQVIRMPPVTAASIRRLILVAYKDAPCGETPVYICIQGLINLECLYSFDRTFYVPPWFAAFRLPKLRELCLTGVRVLTEPMAKALSGPNLEILVVASQDYLQHPQISRLLEASSALRILAIAGNDSSYVNRRAKVTLSAPALREPSGSRPLKVFVGGEFTRYVRFTQPENPESANFRRIDRPMPGFLAKSEVAVLFKDVWLAKVIREGSSHGLRLWGSPNQRELFYSKSACVLSSFGGAEVRF